MNRTAWGATVAAVIGALFLWGLAAGSIAPALLAVLLLAGLEGARARLRTTPLHATREVPGATMVGATFRVRTHVTSPHAQVPLRIVDDGIRGVDVQDQVDTTGIGHARRTVQATPRDPAVLAWRSVTAAIQDPWGLHETERTVPAASRLRVAAEPALARSGKQAGRRHPVRTMGRRRMGTSADLEPKGIRQYQPGDAIRDIDWAHSSRRRTLHVREREQMAPRGVHLLLDDGASVRWHLRTSRSASIRRFAELVAAAVPAAGARIHVDLLGGNGTRSVPARSLATVLGDAVPITAIPPPITDARPEAEWTAPFLARAGRTGGRDALVAVLDIEWDPRPALALLHAVARSRLRMVLVAPALGRHHHQRSDVDAAALRTLRAAMANRGHVEAVATRLGTPVHILHPDNVEQVAQEVVAWLQ